MKLFYFTSVDITEARSGARDHIEGVVRGLVDIGWDLTLFSSSLEGKSRALDLGCRHILTPKRNYTINGQLAEQWALLRKLLTLNEPPPDAIYIRGAYTVVSPVIYAMHKRVPYFLEINALASYESSHQKLVPLGIQVENWAIRHARRTFVVTEQLRDHLARRTGLNPERFVVMPNGVDDSLLEIPNNPKSIEEGRSHVIGFLGTFQERQGVVTLLQAFPEVKQKIPEVKLVIAGSGPESERYMKLAGELGISDRVHFPGFIPKDGIKPLLSSFDVAVAPFTRLQETLMGSPIKLFTYLACANIVITSDLPSLHIFKDCPAVRFASPEDPHDLALKILEVLSMNPEKRRELGEKGREFILKNGHTWSRIARKTAEVILESLGAKGNTSIASNEPI